MADLPDMLRNVCRELNGFEESEMDKLDDSMKKKFVGLVERGMQLLSYCHPFKIQSVPELNEIYSNITGRLPVYLKINEEYDPSQK